MTLTLYVYYLDENTGEERPVPLDYDVFGFESSRKNLWGLPILRELGLILLPQLEEGSLNVAGDELDQLEREANLLFENYAIIAQHTNYDDGRLYAGKTIIQVYAVNLLEAVKKARAVNGYVII